MPRCSSYQTPYNPFILTIDYEGVKCQVKFIHRRKREVGKTRSKHGFPGIGQSTVHLQLHQQPHSPRGFLVVPFWTESQPSSAGSSFLRLPLALLFGACFVVVRLLCIV